MIHEFKIGDVSITRVCEYVGPTHDPAATYPAFERDTFERAVKQLPDGFYIPSMDKLVIAVNIWVVRKHDNIILVDAGVGNGKTRPAARMNRLNSLTLSWLEAAGATRHSVTHVLLTHLHGDHIGWNTVKENGTWEPTFPNAKYFVPSWDLSFFKENLAQGGSATSDGSMQDSLLPIDDAGLLHHYAPGDELAGCLDVVDARGHTPGMANFWLHSKGEVGVFCSDVFHHPIQILNPNWNTAFCMLPEDAIATRERFLEQATKRSAMVMPCHFAGRGYGRIFRVPTGYSFAQAP